MIELFVNQPFKAIKTVNMLYFIQSLEWYKVGYTNNPQKRFEAYRTCNPQIKILGLKEGDEKDEKAYHRRFQQYTSFGKEWFKIPEDVVKYLKQEFPISYSFPRKEKFEKQKRAKKRIIERCKNNPKEFKRSKFHFYCRASKLRLTDLTSPIEISFFKNDKRTTLTTKYRWDPLTFSEDKKKQKLKQLLKDLITQYENNI